MKHQKVELEVQINEDDDAFKPGTHEEWRKNKLTLSVEADREKIVELDKAIRVIIFEVVSE